MRLNIKAYKEQEVDDTNWAYMYTTFNTPALYNFQKPGVIINVFTDQRWSP